MSPYWYFTCSYRLWLSNAVYLELSTQDGFLVHQHYRGSYSRNNVVAYSMDTVLLLFHNLPLYIVSSYKCQCWANCNIVNEPDLQNWSDQISNWNSLYDIAIAKIHNPDKTKYPYANFNVKAKGAFGKAFKILEMKKKIVIDCLLLFFSLKIMKTFGKNGNAKKVLPQFLFHFYFLPLLTSPTNWKH